MLAFGTGVTSLKSFVQSRGLGWANVPPRSRARSAVCELRENFTELKKKVSKFCRIASQNSLSCLLFLLTETPVCSVFF